MDIWRLFRKQNREPKPIIPDVCKKPTDAEGKVTYSDIEREFSKDDLFKYNSLCKRFVELRAGKNNIELWNMAQNPSEFRIILDDIHAVRGKYDLLKGETFFKVWRFDPNTSQYEEMCW